MYLKSIEIQGFKSFPDKVFVEFGQGITSIVGPNGSGKSNISDAVRWVLGEQSARSLRGSKMEDIIFAGTELRKPVGFAEVSLTLNNINKILPIEYAEVTITRRVYRSGESEYFINKSSCRLKDIHQLFMDTGLGKEGYSIIGQGKIDEILSSKSEDRRMIFEEAAGITKYKYRKEEAEKKLELTRQNLIRLKDIISELATQVEPLREQSEKAKKYLDLKHKLKILEINVCMDRIKNIKKESIEINGKFSSVASELNDEQKHLERLETELESLHRSIKEEEIKISQNKDDLYGTESLIQKSKNDIVILENNIKNNQEILDKLGEESLDIEKKISILRGDIEEKEISLQNHREKKRFVKDEIDNLNRKNSDISQNIDKEKLLIENFKADVIEKMNMISEKKVKLNGFRTLENNFEQRKASIDKELKIKEINADKLKREIASLKCDFSSLFSSINEKELQLESKQSKIKMAKDKHEKLSNQYNSLVMDSKEILSRKTLLEDMERDYEGYNKSVKTILKAWENGRLRNLGIHGALSQLITVPDKFTLALEIALGAAMQNIVVEKEEDAKQAIQFLKNTKSGRTTFLPISSVRASALREDNNRICQFNGFQGIASKLISFDKKYQNIIDNLLARVVIVDKIENAINMAKAFNYRFRIVTLDGEVLNPGGSISGGSINRVNSFLSRTKEIEKLAEKLSEIYASIGEVEANIAEQQREIEKYKKNHESIQGYLKKEQSRYIALESEIKHSESLYGQILADIESLSRENRQIEEQIYNTHEEAGRLLKAIKIYEDEVKTEQIEISQKQSEYSEQITAKDDFNKQLMEQKIVLASINKDIDVLQDRIQSIQNEIAEYDNNKNYKNKQIIELENKKISFHKDIEEKEAQINNLQKRIDSYQKNITSSFDKKQEAEKNIDVLQNQLKDKREKISILQNEYHRLENKKIRIDLELDDNINKLWDEYELTLTGAEDYKQDIKDIHDAPKRISVLKMEINGLGNINVNAIEEYKNTKERYEFLSIQHDDLKKAELDLVKVIEELLGLMEKQFQEQFKIINKYFHEVFIKLFGGGKAELRLADADDILQSGIEIEVQPPGKKLQNIMLLSGGEKAFTAIALLFAILKVRPTPFCILDEIEAALDDANVYRFARYLEKFSEETQFIIVTHRRGTMEVADILYGVTMQEKGVSKLLPLKMDEIAS